MSDSKAESNPYASPATAPHTDRFEHARTQWKPARLVGIALIAIATLYFVMTFRALILYFGWSDPMPEEAKNRFTVLSYVAVALTVIGALLAFRKLVGASLVVCSLLAASVIVFSMANRPTLEFFFYETQGGPRLGSRIVE